MADDGLDDPELEPSGSVTSITFRIHRQLAWLEREEERTRHVGRQLLWTAFHSFLLHHLSKRGVWLGR